MEPREQPRDSLLVFLADRDVACPTCGYNLRNLQSGRCPECSLELKLEELSAPRGNPWKAAPGLVCMLIAVVGCVITATRRMALGFSWHTTLCLCVAALVFTVIPLSLQAWDYGRKSDAAARGIGQAGFVFAACFGVVVVLSVM